MKKQKKRANQMPRDLVPVEQQENNGEVVEEMFDMSKVAIREPKRNRRKRKRAAVRTRYYDLRLVWLFLLLAGLVLSVRAVICKHFHIPFLNEIDPNSPNGKEFVGHGLLSEEYREMELWVMLLEALFSVTMAGIFVQMPKNKNCRNDGSETDSLLIEIWKFGSLIFPIIITNRTTAWWIGYGVVMLILAFVIGRYKGFALPLFKDLGKNLWNGSNNVTVHNTRMGSVYFPGHSVVWVSIIGLVIFVILTIYSFHKAW
ncbi:MAG: hypothetical protein E7070_12515 [Bacteroidales bacterium]|jgi:hypothetical protein|nr:hypothetical protein [Bacteroidales bacterium]